MASGDILRTIYVDGPAAILFGAANCAANQFASYSGATELGITDNGVQVSINTLTHRVNSDDEGGSEGNPAEILIMGAIANIRGTLVKYNPAAWDSLISGINGGGVFGLPGTPLFSSGYGFGFWVVGRATALYFPKSELATTPREFNFSTTERRTTFGVTAYPVRYAVGNPSKCVMTPYFVGEGSDQAICNACPTIVAP